MDFLTSRSWRWWDSLSLALYGALVALGVRVHQPWADEAQAWLIARDCSWWQIVAHRMHYEGTPALWQLWLRLLVHLHVSYIGMHWVAAAIAVAGMAVLLRWSPFPAWLRVLLPFTFYFAYQDAVVARSYVLFAPLAFGCAALLRREPSRPLLTGLLIGLMANISVHGFIAALGLAVVSFMQRNHKPSSDGPGMPGFASKKWVLNTAPFAVMLFFFGVAIATAWPARDVNFTAGKNVEKSLNRTERTVGARSVPISRQAPAPGDLKPITPPVHHRTPLQSAEKKLGRIAAVITFPLSEFRALGLALFLLLIARAFDGRQRTRRSGGLLPYLLMVVIFTSLYLAPRHTGMIFTAFVLSAWLTWPETAPSGWRGWRERIFLTCLLLMCIEQIGWTAHALRSEMHGPYSGDKETATFLNGLPPGSRIAGFYYHSAGVLAYFHRNIFFNQPSHSYWLWSRRQRLEARAPQLLASRPDYIVVGGWERGPQQEITVDWLRPDSPDEVIPLDDVYRIVPFFESHGYRITHRFCGDAWMRSSYDEQLCDVVLEPTSPGAQ